MGTPLDPELVAKYQEQRTIDRTVADTTRLCNAPFNNMYFTVTGIVAPCWLTVFEHGDKADRWSPDRSIRDIWFGEKFERIRENIRHHDLTEFCKVCKNNIENNTYPLAKAYDNEHPITEYPSMMEFELSNLCNFECVMCTGKLSSRIREHRDKLPPLKIPYDDTFVEQLEEFIPHLKEARFNGGEPFLHKLAHKIWERIYALNPDCKIVVATNGSVVNDKIRSHLDRGNFHINLSLDAMTKETYEAIRINADFDEVLENLEFFGTYCIERDRNISVMVNPMRMNWQDMPKYVPFCNERNYYLWYNTIHRPEHLALWSLPKAQLQEVYDGLSGFTFSIPEDADPKYRAVHEHNIRTYEHLVQGQVRTWLNKHGQEVIMED